MRNIFRYVLYLMLLMGVASCHSQQNTGITKVDKTIVKTDVVGKNVQLVDVRTPAEYNAGHIDNAVNFDLSRQKTFMDQINSLDKDQPVYVYCAVGARSAQAARILKREGFTKVFDYSGGYVDWMTNR